MLYSGTSYGSLSSKSQGAFDVIRGSDSVRLSVRLKSDTATSNVEAHESKVKFPGLVTLNRWYRGHRCGKNLNMWEEEERGMKEREFEEKMKM